MGQIYYIPNSFDQFLYTIPSDIDCDIWLGHHYTHAYMNPGYGKINTENTIFYNTEQLIREKPLNYMLYINTCKFKEIWDYSTVNIEILKLHGIHAKHVPICSCQWYIDKLQKFISEEGIQYDVGFCGTFSERRTKILNSLIASGVKVNAMNSLYGDDRDRELAKCKIILNIHVDVDCIIYEQARCEPWIRVGKPVISENSLDNDDRCINVPYDKIIEKILEVLQTM